MVRRAWYSRSSLKAILSTPPHTHPYGLGTNPITHLLPRHPRGQDALPALPGENHEVAVVVLVLSAVCMERGAVCMERVGEACSRVGATTRATVDDVLRLVPAVRVVCCPNNAHSFFRTQAGFLVFFVCWLLCVGKEGERDKEGFIDWEGHWLLSIEKISQICSSLWREASGCQLPNNGELSIHDKGFTHGVDLCV